MSPRWLLFMSETKNVSYIDNRVRDTAFFPSFTLLSLFFFFFSVLLKQQPGYIYGSKHH